MFFLTLFVYFYNVIMSVFLKKINESGSLFLYFPYFIILIVYGCLNVASLSVDYSIYTNWLDYIKYDNSDYIVRKDPLFQYISEIIMVFSERVDYVIYLFVILSLFLKLLIGRLFFLKDVIWIYFIFVFSRFYILHDLTQIRASLAISLSMIGYYFYLKNSKVFYFIFLTAFFIHKSVIVFLLFIILLNYIKFYQNKIVNIVAIFLSLVFYLCSESISKNFLFYIDDDRLSLYGEGAYINNSTISIFSFYVLLKFSILLFNYFSWNKLTINEKKINYMVFVGLFFQTIFASNAVLGWRFSELFAFFDIFSLIMLLKYFDEKTKYMYFLYLILVSVLILYATYFSGKQVF
ncbi:EpsG family protein [Acinetobacter bohemicus]|uniref:EpsG family protein n=1 Tax=Acinetobacter bohemicus TaxID=1435036 RepID=UPI004041A9DA